MSRRNTGHAEQDNRVRIPDGTAAVCADGSAFRRKPVTGKLGRRAGSQGVAAPAKHESEDLRNVLSHSLRVYGGCACRRKTAAAPLFGAAAESFFQEEIIMKNKKLVVALVLQPQNTISFQPP